MAEEIDKELAKGLQVARKKPRNFAIIAKGANVMGLLVEKKPIKDGALVKAKKEFQGNAIVKGVVRGSGQELVFEVLEEPSVGEPKLKNFITDTTRLTLKPRFQVVSGLEEIDDNAPDEAVEELAQPVPAAPTSPPPAEPSADQLVAALNKLAPTIKQAVADHPDRKADILQFVAAFQAHVKASELAQAKQALLQVGALLKSLSASAATPEMPSGDLPESGVSQFEAIYRGLLETLPADFQRLAKSDAATAEKLQKIVDGAAGFAQKGDFQQAAKYLERAAAALARVAGASQAQEAAAAIPENVVQDRKRFLASGWQTALSSVHQEIEKLRPKVAELLPSASGGKLLDGIHNSLDQFCKDLSDVITGASQASAVDLKPLDAALVLLRDYRQRVTSDERIRCLSDAKAALGVEVNVSGVLLNALGELESRLAS